jgi:hypothetical protein
MSSNAERGASGRTTGLTSLQDRLRPDPLLEESANDTPVSLWKINPAAKSVFIATLVIVGLAGIGLIVGYYAAADAIRESEGTPDDHEKAIAELAPMLYTGIVDAIAMFVLIGLSARYINMFLTCCGICRCCVVKENRALSVDMVPQGNGPRDSVARAGPGRHHRGRMHTFGQEMPREGKRRSLSLGANYGATQGSPRDSLDWRQYAPPPLPRESLSRMTAVAAARDIEEGAADPLTPRGRQRRGGRHRVRRVESEAGRDDDVQQRRARVGGDVARVSVLTEAADDDVGATEAKRRQANRAHRGMARLGDGSGSDSDGSDDTQRQVF